VQHFAENAVLKKKDNMKRLILLLPVLAVLATGCKDENTGGEMVEGGWKWRYSVGGFGGNDTIRPWASDTVILELNADLTYKETRNGNTTAQGTYVIEDVTSIYSQQQEPAVIFDTAAAYPLLIDVNGDHLILRDNTTEPYAHHYIMQ
jgi:hypothetical protein